VTVTESELEGSLFKRVNQRDSGLNVLLGAKKFIEGWSSWCVSTMGLMNIGRGRGATDHPAFRARRAALSTAILEQGPHPQRLTLLETLSIFGVRAKYVAQFRGYLEQRASTPKSEKMSRSRPVPTTGSWERAFKSLALNRRSNPRTEENESLTHPMPTSISTLGRRSSGVTRGT